MIVDLLCRHEAERLEQEAKGRLEEQKIMDEAEAERTRKELFELQAHRYECKLCCGTYKHIVLEILL